MIFHFITPTKAINCPKIWKSFSASTVKKAELKITGLGLYRAFLNGKRIGRDYLTPGFNDYDVYLRYQTYDVTSLMEENNHLEIYLGNGWYKGRYGVGNCLNRWGCEYLLGLELTWSDSSGSTYTLDSDDSFQASASCFLDNSIYDGEIRDDTFEPSEIVSCREVAADYHVEPQSSPCIRIVETFKPTLIITPKGDSVLDFGQNMAGIIRFVNRLPRGQKLCFQTGEVMQKDEFYRDNYRSAKSEYTYVSDGTVKEVEPWFTFYGFRYVRVQGPDKVNPEDFTALALSSDLETTLSCETGNPLINQLIHNTFWGQRSNFLDIPTDCPQRDERLGWTGDTQVFSNTACYQMNCKEFFQKFMRDLRADQINYCSGFLPQFSPCLRGWGPFGGAVWADAATILPMTVYQHYGDKDQLLSDYPMMHDYCEALILYDNEKGGTHIDFDCHCFGDWLAMDGLSPQYCWGGTKKEFIQGIYYYHSLTLTAEAANELGITDDGIRYSKQAEAVKEALLDEYFTPNGNLCIDTQTAYTIALKFGVYRSKERVISGFRYRLYRDFYKLKCGFTGAPLILPVLFDNGMEEEAFRILFNEEFPGWLYCVKLGATTIWERWNSLNPDGSISGTDMNSLNHYAYGTVCEAIYSHIAGLRSNVPGWKKALIKPHIDGRLKYVDLTHDSAAGQWKTSWVIRPDGSVRLSVTVPEGAEAHIVLPDHPEHLEESLSAGSRIYEWMPTRDYLHPFGLNSLMLDLLHNPEAKALLRTYLCRFSANWEDASDEIALKTLQDFWMSLPFESRNEKEKSLLEITSKLRAISA